MKKIWTNEDFIKAAEGSKSLVEISNKLGLKKCPYSTFNALIEKLGLELKIKRSIIISPGDKFGMWTIIKKTTKRAWGSVYYECLCDCGKKSLVSSSNLRKGGSKSCGCIQKKRFLEITKELNKTRIKNEISEIKHRSGVFVINENVNIYDKMLIYKFTNLVNGKVYIGQTHGTLKYLIQRYNREVLFKSKRPIIYAMIKYGTGNFSLEITEKISDINDLNKREEFYVSHYKSNHKNFGYNLTYGGDGVRGYKRSPENIEKHRKMMLGRFKGSLNPFYQKKHNKDTIDRVVESNKNRKGEKRKPLSEEHKKKIRKSKRRKNESSCQD